MGFRQTEQVGWSCLPALLAERILHLAFRDSSRAFSQWLCMSLVCRCDVRHTAAMQTPRVRSNCCYVVASTWSMTTATR